MNKNLELAVRADRLLGEGTVWEVQEQKSSVYKRKHCSGLRTIMV